MAAISVTYTAPDAARGAPNKPVTTGLVMDIWNAVEYVKQWLGHSFIGGAVRDHSHDGVDSSLINVGPNYLRNGSFELDELGWTFTNFSGGSRAVSSSNHADGAKSIEFTSTVLANGGGEAVSTEYRSCGANELIPISFWVWASVINVSSRVEIIWYDNTKSQISATTVRQYTSTPTLARFHGEAVYAPANARWNRLRITGGVPALGSATGTVRFDGIRQTAAQALALAAEVPLNIIKQSAINLAQGSTTFLTRLGTGGDATEANQEIYVVKPFTIQELRGLAAAAVPASNTVVFTVRKNGADTALTCTIGAGQTQAADTTNKINFGVGDRFAIKCVSSASAGTNDYSATAKVMKPDSSVGMPCIFYKGDIITGNNSYAEFGGVSEFGTSLASSLPMPRCLTSYSVSVVGGATHRLRKNNVDAATGLSANALAELQQDADPTISVDESDRLSVTDTANAVATHIQVLFKSVDELEHDPCPMGFTWSSQAQGLTRYGGGLQSGALATDEGEASIPMPACRVRNLRGVIDTAPTGSETVIVKVRKNGADTGLTLTFTNAGGTAASNFSDEVSFAAGDYMSAQGITSAGVGTRTFSVSMEPFA
jgi:hypothetical protein